jgi:hypothetical protein
MNEAKASQSEDSRSMPGKVRNRNPFLISYNNEFDRPSTTHQNANLASDFIREFNEEASEFRRHNLLRRDFPSVDVFDSSDLIRLQTDDIPVNPVNLFLLI